MRIEITSFFLFFTLLLPVSSRAANIIWTGAGSNNDWSNPQNWSGGVLPGPNDDVTIPSGTEDIALNTTAIVRNFTFGGGYIAGTGSLTINGVLDWPNELAFYQDVSFILSPTATFTLETNPVYQEGRSAGGPFLVQGNMTMKGGYFGTYTAPFIVSGTLNWVYGNLYSNLNIASSGTLIIDGDLQGYQRLVDDTLRNDGVLIWRSGELRTAGGLILNNGLMRVEGSDHIMTGGFPPLGTEQFINNGTLEVAATVPALNINVHFKNTGVVNLLGATDLQSTVAISQEGILSGNMNAKLSILGGGPNFFKSGSITRNLQEFYQGYPYMITTAEANAQFENIGLIHLRDGAFVSHTVLPANSNYRLGSFPLDFGVYGGWEQHLNMEISGTLELGYGILSGPATITLNADDAVWNGAFVSCNLVVNLGSILQIGQSGQAFSNYLGSLASPTNSTVPATLVNKGTVNVVSPGQFGSGEHSIWFNQGVINVAADSFALGSGFSYYSFATTNLLNAGSINVAQTASAFSVGFPLINDGQLNMPGNTNLYLASTRQNANISSNGGKFYATGDVVEINANSSTLGFTEMTLSAYQSGKILNGSDLGNTGKFNIFYSNDFQILRPMPNAASYHFEGAVVTLNNPLSPIGTVVSRYATLQGAGSLSIINSLEWLNGIMDIPLTIQAGANASISTDSVAIFYSPSPTISAPFVNHGTLTWLGGAIVAEGQQVLNSGDGTWQIESSQDVQMDGSLSFLNNGTFRNCSTTPIAVVFNLPVNNNGSMSGAGAYTFNAGFTNNGVVNPGCSPGHLVIEGDFTAGQAINIEIMGNTPTAQDHLQVNGNMVAAGQLNLQIANDVDLGTGLPIIESTGLMTGQFSQINLPGGYIVSIVNNQVMLERAAPVPVEWLNFEASPEKNSVVLTWSTASERNTSHFDVEHSPDGLYYTKVGMARAAGNSTDQRAYRWKHDYVTAGKHYYRIRQVDNDGQSTYSAIQSATVKGSGITVSPSLASDYLNVRLGIVPDQTLMAEIFDLNGKLCKAVTVEGENTEINLHELSRGQYLLRISGDGKSETIWFSKQ